MEPPGKATKRPSSFFIHAIVGEIQNVLSVMRHNVKFSSNADSNLVYALKSLRKILSPSTDFPNLPATKYLKPFLDVIKSEETTGPITGAALTSVLKFLTLDFINCETPSAAVAMKMIADSVNHCRYEATDPESDDVVHMKILQALVACLNCSAGILLSDEMVFSMILTCLRMSNQLRLAELLRRFAEQSLTQMIHIIFKNQRVKLQRYSSSDVSPSQSSSKNTNSVSGPSPSPSPSSSASSSSSISPFAPFPSQDPASSSAVVPIDQNNEPESASLSSKTSAVLAQSTGILELSSSPPTPATLASSADQVSSSAPSPSPASSSASSPNVDVIVNSQGVRFQRSEEETSGNAAPSVKPYGVDCLIKIINYLTMLSSPYLENVQVSESIRPTSLRIFNSIIESFPDVINNSPPILALFSDKICLCLLQNLMVPTDDLGSFNLILRIFFNLYATCRTHLKAQFEIFFNNLLQLLDEKSDFSYERLDIAFENVVEFFRQPNFLLELFLNYDCAIPCSNIAEKYIRFFSKNSMPYQDGKFLSIQLLSIEALRACIFGLEKNCRLAIEASFKDRSHLERNNHHCKYDSTFRDTRSKKKKLLEAVQQFNQIADESLTKGLEFLVAQGLIPPELPPALIAKAFREWPGVNKDIIGRYLGKSSDFNIEILKEFVGSFDFRDMKLETALRQFLTSFLIPKEAQIIDRILQFFGPHYISMRPGIFSNSDACYVLCFSIVLLNVDAHNATVRRKMSLEEYIRSLRGVNDGKDFPPEMLTSIYENIVNHEIKMCDAEPSGIVTDDRWPVLLERADIVGPYLSASSLCSSQPLSSLSSSPSVFGSVSGVSSSSSSSSSSSLESLAISLYDTDCFAAVCRPIIACFGAIFEISRDENLLQYVLKCYKTCAMISSFHELCDSFDSIVISLSKFSSLITESAPTGKNPGQAGASRSSSSAATLAHSNVRKLVNFGKNLKAQYATLSIFQMTLDHGDYLREGWRNIIESIVAINEMDPSELQDENALEMAVRRTARSTEKKGANPSSSTSSSILSVFGIGSGWFGSAEKEPEVSPELVEAENQAKACIQRCSIKRIIHSSKNLQADSLLFLIKALILHSMPTQNKEFKEENGIFCLGLLTNITLINQDRIIFVWMLVYEHFAGIISATKTPSPLVEKAVVCLLLLCFKLVHIDEITDRILRCLKLFLKLEAPVADAMSESIAIAVDRLLQSKPPCIIDTPKGAKVVFRLLARCPLYAQARQRGFKALVQLIDEPGQPALTSITYAHIVDVLVAFASANDASDFEQKLSVFSIKYIYRLFELIPQITSRDPVLSLHVENISLSPDPISAASSAGCLQSPSLDQEWKKYWFPLFAAFKSLSRDQRPDIRHHAINFLQRTLLHPMTSQRVAQQPLFVESCFYQVVFPLLQDLLQPFKSKDMQTAISIDETRVRGITGLLSQILLHYLNFVIQLPDFHHKLWIDILKYIELYLQSDKSGVLAEAVPEALKNILLVMLSHDAFSEKYNQEGQDAWVVSWCAIDSFCPALKLDESFQASLSSFHKTPFTKDGQVFSVARSEAPRPRDSEKKIDAPTPAPSPSQPSSSSSSSSSSASLPSPSSSTSGEQTI